MLNQKTNAFTMSEILIALTIVAVLAVMTLPALISNSATRANKLKAKSAFNNLANALQIADAKLGYDLSAISALSGGTGTMQELLTKTIDTDVTTSASHKFSGNLFSVTNTGTISSTSTTTGVTGAVIFEMRDGSFAIFPENSNIATYGCTKTYPCVGYIDVNGTEGPNTVLTCSSGTETLWVKDTSFASCVVDENNLADIYPIVVYGVSIRPANNAFDTVLGKTE